MDQLAALLPSGMEPWVAVLLVIASAFTSALTAAFGIGGGIAMLALMGLFVPVTSVIPVHGAVQLGSNSGRAWHQRANVRLDVAKPFIVGSVAGAVVGVFLVVQLPDWLLKLLLGGFILLLTWVKIPGIDRLTTVGLSIASAGLALLSMLVGATGPLIAVLLARFFENDRKALIATSAVAMTTQHLLKIVVFGIAGFAFREWLPLIAAMILSGFVGTVYGTALLERMPEATFRKWFRIGITLLALDLLRRGLIGLQPQI
ncbi:MAG: sulfite exporter TauE/SafE family protein [Rhizobiaceae bacterium]|nr:sulfite exporter TauE/SafE family protein [Rhizobiaceae bacterium]